MKDVTEEIFARLLDELFGPDPGEPDMTALTAAAADKLTPEERRAERQERAQKAWQTRRQNFTPEQISEQIREGMRPKDWSPSEKGREN